MRKKLLMLLVLGLIGIGIVGCDETESAETEKTTETTESTEDKKTTEAIEEEKKESDNPLMNAKVIVNELGSGQYATISIDLDIMKNITMEQYDEFCTSVVSGSGYNWITIDFQDGTGLVFTGSNPVVATYSKIDMYGRSDESIGFVSKIDQGKYEYEEKSN